MYYPCSENKGADQLRGYREADLRLCFRIGKNPVFSRCGSNKVWLFVITKCIVYLESITFHTSRRSHLYLNNEQGINVSCCRTQHGASGI